MVKLLVEIPCRFIKEWISEQQKLSKHEMEGIPHYLIDIKNPDEPFSAAEFQELAREKITEITNRGRLPMIVGGTGLYIQSVTL